MASGKLPIWTIFLGPPIALATVALFPLLVLAWRDRRRRGLWALFAAPCLLVWVQWLRSGVHWSLLDRVPGVAMHTTPLPFPGTEIYAFVRKPDGRVDPYVGYFEMVVVDVTPEWVYLSEGDDTGDVATGFLFTAERDPRARIRWADVDSYTWQLKLLGP